MRKTLDSLKPGYESTRYDPALRMAGDALQHAGTPEMTLVWMADEQQLGWKGVDFTSPLPGGVKLVLPPPIDPPARQAAITKAQWSNTDTGLALRVDVAQGARELRLAQDRARGKRRAAGGRCNLIIRVRQRHHDATERACAGIRQRKCGGGSGIVYAYSAKIKARRAEAGDTIARRRGLRR